MAIQITDSALSAVKDAIRSENLPEETYLRVGVKAGGCSGYSYVLQFESEAREGDRVIEKEGVRFLLDPKSETVLKGTTLDYSSGLNGRGFVFENPNATGSCGCGSSFTV
ncbi:MAG: HesB/IscA family protein [Candidatus Eisenbacteria bacterium]|nr:iron-sulfur cluster assembly accessory protein [Candidatus Eisenbacteria bacterium]